MRRFIFMDTEKNTELTLPVTPESFEISHGIRVETVNIHTLGDVNLAGYGALAAVRIDCIFPARAYPFMAPGARVDPYGYVESFRDRVDRKAVQRFIVSDTAVNLPVLVEELRYGERDGTGDVYASLSLREYRTLSAVRTGGAENASRGGAEAPSVIPRTHTVEPGDTLSAICRKYYGDAGLYGKLADYNGIRNPHLIFPGQLIELPDKGLL